MRCCSAALSWLLAVERFIGAVLLGFAVWAVLKFRDAHDSIQAAVDRDCRRPAPSASTSTNLHWFGTCKKALDQAPSRLTLIAVPLAVYAVLELIEVIGLWRLQRWGEYFAVVATSIFLPWKYGTCWQAGITLTRAGAVIVNVAAVLYLLLSKHQLGWFKS